MTREELKTHCLKQIEGCEMWARYKGEEPHGKIYEEHKLILELLEKEPCDDCVSRKTALKKAKSYNTDGWDSYTPLVVDVEDIEELPQVTPMRPKMRWIDHSDEGYVECPKCGSATNCDDNITALHFCFSCGAEMRGEEI
jgi:DNA-directed RNA polymerase subunit RPC12/RpoP